MKIQSFAPIAPPPIEVVEALVEYLNGRVKSSSVKVSLLSILKSAGLQEQWSLNTAEGVAVPIGRYGAGEIQYFSLDRAMNAHVLVGGATGSGKSTLMHAIICSLVHCYSPEELELYLVDFKGGVEFVDYDRLPHARVVAIQSEPEFGVSVLKGLVEEMHRREELFRDENASDLTEFRKKTGAVLPRIVFFFDEYVRIFDAPSRVAAEAANLMEIIAAQGRSMGIHMALATQSPGAATAKIELSKTTRDQLKIRIAMKCTSESQAAAILSTDNIVPTQFTRPGQALYNDNAGQKTSNVVFQVAMPEVEAIRDAVLAEAERRGFTNAPLVYESKRPIRYQDNPLFLESSAGQAVPRYFDVFVGEPAALQRGHSFLRVRRRSGGNVLIAGKDPAKRSASNYVGETTATFASALLSIAGQLSTVQCEMLLFNYAPDDAEDWAVLDRLGRSRPNIRVADVAGEKSLAEEIGALQSRLQERLQPGATVEPVLILGICGLDEARDIRAGSQISKALLSILDEGPARGMHTVCTTSTVEKLKQRLGMDGLKLFDNRVIHAGAEVAAMSNNSIDLTAVSPRSALLFNSEEPGQYEKVRPYWPSKENVEWLLGRMGEL